MRILMVTGIFPPDIGGPASYVPRMAQALLRRGHHVEVITLADEPAPGGPADYEFRVHRIARQLRKPWRMTKAVALIAALGRKAELIYAHGLVLETVIAARLAARPVVVKVVGDTVWERARNAGRGETMDEFQVARLPRRWRALRALQDAYMRSVRRVIVPSFYLRRIVTGWGVPTERVSVVYNAVALPKGAPGRAPSFDLVSVGRLVPWKGFSELIGLAARRGWSLRIVGDGPLRADLERQAKSAGAAVRFDGHVPQGEVAAALGDAKAFVLNSSYEGLPHIVLEAMAAGVPVVATAAGGTPETIADGESGLLVPVGATDRLEQAVARLLADSGLRERLAERARAILTEKFSFARMVEDTEKVLESVAAGRPAAIPAR